MLMMMTMVMMMVMMAMMMMPQYVLIQLCECSVPCHATFSAQSE